MKIHLIHILTAFIALLSVLIFLLSTENGSNLPAKQGENWLLLIAHPDDESMFFAPALLNLMTIGVNLTLVCITSGNSQGLGPIRIKELFSAATDYGIPKGQVLFVDPEERNFLDGMHSQWDLDKLSAAFLPFLHRVEPKGLITFDRHGISGHPNHEDCYRIVKMLRDNGNITKAVDLLALESVSLWRKYSSFLDLFYVLFMENDRIHALWADPISVYRAMSKHRSQLLWFRYLYMAFSRYVYVNTFITIA